MSAGAAALVWVAAATAFAALAHVAYAAWVRLRFPPSGERVRWERGTLRLARRGSGPPVLFVHGMNGTAHDFPDALLDDLARDHTVPAMDRPGHAGSSRDGRRLDLEANARAVLAVLAAAGEPAVLVGHSYGAAVVLRAALDAPGSVAGVVLLSPCTIVDDRNRRHVELPVPPGIARRVALWLGTLPVGLLLSRRTRRDAWHPAEPPAAFTFSRAWALVPSQIEAALENFHTLPADFAALAADAPRLVPPLAVLVGASDIITPWITHADWLPRAVHGATLQVLDGVGHWLPRQQPELVADAVRRLRARSM